MQEITLDCNEIVSKRYPDNDYGGNWLVPLKKIFNSQINTLRIGKSVTHIGDYAFKDFSDLTSVIFLNSTISFSYLAFAGCLGLLSSPLYSATCFAYLPRTYEGEYTIPSGITTVSYGAFSGCSGLTSVLIPSSVKSIGYEAFKGCSALTSVIIPDSVVTLENYAFSICI